MPDRNERWVLNHLIEICRDEERTLRYAAEHVTSPSTRALLADLASQRARFAADLLPHAQRLGGAEAADSTTRGTLRRRWRALRNTLVSYKDAEMLAEAEHGEDVALGSYRHALDEMLPPTTRDLVEVQCEAIRQDHQRVRAFLH